MNQVSKPINVSKASWFQRLFSFTRKKEEFCYKDIKKKTLFIGNIFPDNAQHMFDVVLKNAISMGGFMILSKESSMYVTHYLRNQGSFDFANKLAVINLKSIGNSEELSQEIESLLKVDCQSNSQKHFAANKMIVLIVYDDVELQSDYLKSILLNIKKFAFELFDTELTWNSEGKRIPFLIENYNLYQMIGFSIVGAQGRGLGFDFHFSVTDFDATTKNDEFKSVVANSELIAVYGGVYDGTQVRVI